MGTLHNRAYTCLLCCEHNRKIVNSIQLSSLAFRAFYSHLSLFFLFFFRFFSNEICVYSFCARVGNVKHQFYIYHTSFENVFVISSRNMAFFTLFLLLFSLPPSHVYKYTFLFNCDYVHNSIACSNNKLNFLFVHSFVGSFFLSFFRMLIHNVSVHRICVSTQHNTHSIIYIHNSMRTM